MICRQGTISYGSEMISYILYYAARKTLEIAVYPDNKVIVKAPQDADLTTVEFILAKRAGWIKRQLNYYSKFEPQMPPRYYVGGETHRYMGKQYRLKIDYGDNDQVKLVRGYFIVTISQLNKESMLMFPPPEQVKPLMDSWYIEKARKHFHESLDRCWTWFGCREKMGFVQFGFVEKPQIQIRKMKRRWGSLSQNGILTLNIDLICAPKECIDYVITHELCHVYYHDHGADFYRLLDTVMPDWEKRKARLEMAML